MTKLLINITSNINNSNFDYLPHIVFIGLIVIGIIFGIWFGKASSIYFCISVAISLIVTILFVAFGTDFILNSIFKNDIKIGNFSLQGIIHNNSGYVAAVFAGPIFFITLIGLLLIKTIIDLLTLRRLFKNSIKEARKAKISTKSTRINGGIISFIGVLPVAIIAATYLATLGHSNNISLVYSKVAKIITFGQMSETTENLRNLLQTTHAVLTLVDTGQGIAAIIGSKDSNMDSLLNLFKDKETRDAFNTIFTSKLVSDNINVIVSQVSTADLSRIDLTRTSGDIAWVSKIPSEYTLTLPRATVKVFADNLDNALHGSGANVTSDGIMYFLTKIQAIKYS